MTQPFRDPSRSQLSSGRAAPYLGAFALVLLAAFCAGCKKDEAPPPLPIVQAEEKKAEVPFELTPEDAGVPAAPKEKKKTRRRRSSKPKGSLKSCCNALRQNAANAPEPTRQYMTAAATTCDLLATQGKDKNTAAAMIVGMLKGAGLPAQCK